MRITLRMAGLSTALECRYQTYLPVYQPFLTDEAPVGTVSAEFPTPEETALLGGNSGNAAYDEHMLLSYRISDFLLRYDRVLFHSVAFRLFGKAWLITAPPGTGKTTLYLLLKQRYGDAVQMICGDKPIVRLKPDGTVTVHPSPWNGKENMGQCISAPLGGVFLLKRGTENSVTRAASSAAVPLYLQFLYTAETAEQVHAVCRIEDAVLRSGFVWELTCRGDTASAELCCETIREAIL